MATERPPDVVRERADGLGAGRVSCAIIFDRELSREEISRFYLVEHAGRPAPMDFDVAGRVISWECRREDEVGWRLALEIFLVKSFRAEKTGARPPLAPDRASSRPPGR